jgi:hypothetical protein
LGSEEVVIVHPPSVGDSDPDPTLISLTVQKCLFKNSREKQIIFIEK